MGNNSSPKFLTILQAFVDSTREDLLENGVIVVRSARKNSDKYHFKDTGLILTCSDLMKTKEELVRPHPGSKTGDRVSLNGCALLSEDQK